MEFIEGNCIFERARSAEENGAMLCRTMIVLHVHYPQPRRALRTGL